MTANKQLAEEAARDLIYRLWNWCNEDHRKDIIEDAQELMTEAAEALEKQQAQHEAERAAAVAEALERVMRIVKAIPSDSTVQSCCICYGGGSFSGPMQEALLCHGSILVAAIRALKPRSDLVSVPREPTAEMIDALYGPELSVSVAQSRRVAYKTMLAAVEGKP